MAQDISVNSIDLLRAYNGKIKTFNTSVNVLLLGFRNKIEETISENKRKLNTLERDYEVNKNRVDDKIENLERIIDQYDWYPESLSILDAELQRLSGISQKLDRLMESIRHEYNQLEVKLDQLLQSTHTFALSNKSLLNNNINRMNEVINYLSTYKSTNL